MMRRRMGRPSLVGTMARTAVVAGTATAVAGGVSRSQQAKAGAAQQQQAEQQAAQQNAAQSQAEIDQLHSELAAVQAQQNAAPAPPVEDDMFTKLERLAKLHTAGVLTDEEFAGAKAAVLNA